MFAIKFSLTIQRLLDDMDIKKFKSFCYLYKCALNKVANILIFMTLFQIFLVNSHSYADTIMPQLDIINQNIVSGGPPKDGIPAIDHPTYVTSTQARFLTKKSIVFGWIDKGLAKALPMKIMVWHEIVNDGNDSITYCPLTGSVIRFVGYSLGTSGKLYNSNLVMYDRKTGSEIPQLLKTAVNGALKGVLLPQKEVVKTTWEQWKKVYPNTLVLSNNTGIYSQSRYEIWPYPSYNTSSHVRFTS